MDTGVLLGIAIVIGAIVVIVLVALAAYRRAWRIPQPNEALVIVGKKRGGESTVLQERIEATDETVTQAIKADKLEGLDYRIATAGVWVNPVTSRVFPLSLKSRTVGFTADAHDRDKISVSVRGVLLFKVGDNFEAMARAARRFLDMEDADIDTAIEQLVTGQVRALVGGMSVVELLTDRQKLVDEVRSATTEDMAKLGLQIDSLSIQQIEDSQGYIENLGKPQAEQVAREASIAADQARRAREEAKQAADVHIAEVRRDTEVKAAEFQAEQDRAREKAAQSGPLARAEAEAAVVEQETKVAESRVLMAAKRYEAEVHERAKADRFRVEQEAEAGKARELAAVAAEAARERDIGDARASAIRAAGEAEAESVRLLGLAEAEALQKRVEALKEGGDAVIEQRIAEVMPQIAEAVAGPLGSIDNLVVLDGPEGVTKAVTGGIAQVGNTAFNIMDLVQVLRGNEPAARRAARADGDGDGAPVATTAAPAAPQPQEQDLSAWEAPPLDEIVSEYKPTPRRAAEEAGESGVEDVQSPDEALELLQGMLTEGGPDPRDLADQIRDNPDVRHAFYEVAQDDQAYESLLENLPFRGPARTVAEKFLGSYRDSVLGAVEEEK